MTQVKSPRHRALIRKIRGEPPIEEIKPPPILPRRTPIEPLAERAFVSKTQLKILREGLETGRLTREAIVKPLWVSPAGARELGIEIEPGETLRFDPKEHGAEASYQIISPEGVEAPGVPEDGLLDVLERLYPESPLEESIAMLERLSGEGLLPEEYDRAIQLQDAFLDDIVAKGRSEDTEALLRGLGLEDEDIDDVFEVVETRLRPRDEPTLAVPAEVKPRATQFLENQWGEGLVKEVSEGLDKPYILVTNLDIEDYILSHPAIWEQVEAWQKKYPALTLADEVGILGGSLLMLPQQWGAAILQSTQGFGGASVVDKDWADRFIEDANEDMDKFVGGVSLKYKDRPSLLGISPADMASVSRNIAYSLTSMGAGLIVGLPTALLPVPGARVAAWTAGTAASGAVAYQMTTYQITQTYLELMNEEKVARTGSGLTRQEEEQLKDDFADKARKYGLWEAIPEAVSNLAFAKLLTTPLTSMVGRSIASRIVTKIGGIYGEELLTETITQKGQSDIEVEAGLREGRITWIEAFKEVAPQTFLLTTILGGTGQVSVSAVNRIKASLKSEIGTEHPLFNEINENITEDIIPTDVEPQLTTEIPTIEPEVAPTPITEPVVAPEVTPPAEVRAEPGMPEATKAQQVEYTKRMKPFLEKADADIKKVNDDFMAGKTSLAENQAQRDAINAELDKQADIIRAEMGFPVAKPPLEVAPPTLPPGLKIPIESLSTAELQRRVKTASPHVKLYQAELDKRIPPEIREKPLVPRTELTAEELAENLAITGQPKLTLKQVDALVGFFADYLNDPSSITAWELTRELRRETRAGRAENLKARAQQLIVQEDKTSEEAMKQAISETMAGELPTATTEYFEEMTTELRDALFAKVYHTLKNEPFDMMSTVTALTNALTGRPIPREPGVTGQSAYTRLQRVFGDQPKVLKAIDKMATEHKPLENVVEGMYHEIGREPIPIDQEHAEYLRGLSTRVIYTPTAFREPIPVTRYDAPIEGAFKQPPMFNFMEKSLLNRVLKEIGMLPLDIGNLLRANKASFDNSFLRQSKLLLSGHPIVAWQAHAASWQSMFSQKHTEAEWEQITRDPDFQIYEQIRVDTGHDPLRVPAFAATKGTEQYRTSEEFGFTRQDVERAIPRFTAWLPHVKYSERGFSAGTNKAVWKIWKQKLQIARRDAEKIGSGEATLKEGEAVDIIQEMTEQQSMLGDMIQRANLRRFSGLAPATNAFFFAARSKIGRFLLPKHLIGMTIRDGKVGFNPRIMKEAWKDFFLMTSYISGIMFLGSWLGLWELEDDPRNAEFMSARIGKTRIDPWSGYRQFVVLYARLVTKTGISSVTGAEYDVNPEGALTSFVRNSLSPLASTLLEFWTGRNFLGQVIDYTNAKYWIEKITPFSINDVWEAAEEDWRMGIAVTIPAVYGEGVQTYTGNWEEDFARLGLPKYIENTAYGVTEPYYDTADFWADTSSQFKGVDIAELTVAKGFPEYIRAIAEARIIKEYLSTLPNDKLVSLNADPEKGTTFAQYYQMWRDREKIVASGDEDALTAFDQDERTRNAEKGNFSQRQFALLNEYWTITDKKKQGEFLKEHGGEIGINPRQDYLRTHFKENAQLAVWGQAKPLTKEAYDELNRLIKELDIPDSAIPEGTLPKNLTTFLLETESKFMETSDKIEVAKSLDDEIKDEDGLTARDRAIAELKTTTITGETEFRDVERHVEAIEIGTEDNPTPDDIVKAWGDRGRVVDEHGGSSSEVKSWFSDNLDTYRWALDNGLITDDGGLPDNDPRIAGGRVSDKWNIPVLKITETWRELLDEKASWSNPDSPPDVFIPADATVMVDGKEVNARQAKYDEQYANNTEYRDDIRRQDVYGWYGTDRVADKAVVEAHVEYSLKADEFGANSSDVYLWRHNNRGYDAFRTGLKEGESGYLQPLELKKLPIWQIDVQYATEDTEYDAIPGDDRKAREAYLYPDGNPTEYCLKRYERTAYEKGIPTNQIDNFVGYNTNPDLKRPPDLDASIPFYEDDWWMIEHSGFYKEVYRGILGNLKKDYRKVPYEDIDGVSYRDIGSKYIYYRTRAAAGASGMELDNIRLEEGAGRAMDKWAVTIASPPIWKTTMTEQRRRLGLTPQERFEEGLEELVGIQGVD